MLSAMKGDGPYSRLKPARVDSFLMLSGGEFQVLQAKYLKE